LPSETGSLLTVSSAKSHCAPDIFRASNKNCSAPAGSQNAKFSTNFRLLVAIQVSSAIKGHRSSLDENLVSFIARTLSFGGRLRGFVRNSLRCLCRWRQGFNGRPPWFVRSHRSPKGQHRLTAFLAIRQNDQLPDIRNVQGTAVMTAGIEALLFEIAGLCACSLARNTCQECSSPD
jgi:hypothetical protein